MNLVKWGLIGTGAVIAAGFIGFQAYWYFQADKTEQRAYDKVEQIGDVEIRYYPEATLASVVMNGDMKKPEMETSLMFAPVKTAHQLIVCTASWKTMAQTIVMTLNPIGKFV